MRQATLLFLIKRKDGRVTDILLAMKKRGFGVGRWNGVGGKVKEGETIEAALLRETREEIGVEAERLEKVAELSFTFPHKPEWDQIVHTYFSEAWQGEPAESEEMAPRWYKPDMLPFKEMWADDPLWLPLAIGGRKIRAKFTFGENDVLKEHDVKTVPSL